MPLDASCPLESFWLEKRTCLTVCLLRAAGVLMSLCALEEAAQPILGTYVQSAEAQGALCATAYCVLQIFPSALQEQAELPVPDSILPFSWQEKIDPFGNFRNCLKQHSRMLFWDLLTHNITSLPHFQGLGFCVRMRLKLVRHPSPSLSNYLCQ